MSGSIDPAGLLFDRVVVVEDGRRRELSVDQFLELPLDLRIHLVLTRAVEFYAGMEPVARNLALSSLRRRSV